MRDLLVTPQFKKDLKKLPPFIIEAADLIIPELRHSPLARQFNIKKMTALKQVTWRVRIGDYRITYSFDKKSLILLKFRHRKDIYRDF